MATSRSLLVTEMLPCVNCCETVLTSTPRPAELPPPVPREEATSSPYSAREAFMPVVLALAMLWPITSRLRLVAFRPERPCWKPMVFSFGGA